MVINGIEQDIPARIIRYLDMPGSEVLSVLDHEKNILRINRAEAARLPDTMVNRLETTDLLATKVVDDQFGLRFQAVA